MNRRGNRGDRCRRGAGISGSNAGPATQVGLFYRM
jgi:hypothetical protein